ncbi:MAG TPA: porin family protein [Xanthobacteraceae bacterium]|nr:porin family protein [Xanthobacteraceae bacterium]
MKKFLLGSAALLALIGAANAADLPAPAPAPYVAPAVVQPPSWTGFYVGGGWGYGVWDMNSSVVPAGGVIQGTTNNGGRGWLGQAVAGYDYQFALWNFNLVAGAFADYDFGNMTGTSNFTAAPAGGGFTTLTGVEKEKSFWDVGARIGWLITPDILSYFSGGYSQAHFNGMNLQPIGGVALSTASHNFGGWFTGAGIETKIQSIPGLYFNTEYRFASYNSTTLPVVGSTFALKLQPSQQTVMSGIHYKFNWQ